MLLHSETFKGRFQNAGFRMKENILRLRVSVSGNSLHAQDILGLELHLYHRRILQAVALPPHYQISYPADSMTYTKSNRLL